jgi:hypothetical protein
MKVGDRVTVKWNRAKRHGSITTGTIQQLYQTRPLDRQEDTTCVVFLDDTTGQVETALLHLDTVAVVESEPRVEPNAAQDPAT